MHATHNTHTHTHTHTYTHDNTQHSNRSGIDAHPLCDHTQSVARTRRGGGVNVPMLRALWRVRASSTDIAVTAATQQTAISTPNSHSRAGEVRARIGRVPGSSPRTCAQQQDRRSVDGDRSASARGITSHRTSGERLPSRVMTAHSSKRPLRHSRRHMPWPLTDPSRRRRSAGRLRKTRQQLHQRTEAVPPLLETAGGANDQIWC
jgi:hypothetical protein